MGLSNPIRRKLCSNVQPDCFFIKTHPKLEQFAKNFGGRIAMGDIDGSVERNKYGLMLEWKSHVDGMTDGQHYQFLGYSDGGKITVQVVVGDPETMVVTHMGYYEKGAFSGLFPATIEDVDKFQQDWYRWADTHEPPTVIVGKLNKKGAEEEAARKKLVPGTK